MYEEKSKSMIGNHLIFHISRVSAVFVDAGFHIQLLVHSSKSLIVFSNNLSTIN
jgi:hypothetical protein